MKHTPDPPVTISCTDPDGETWSLECSVSNALAIKRAIACHNELIKVCLWLVACGEEPDWGTPEWAEAVNHGVAKARTALKHAKEAL